ncbi:MAG TPA: FCD domain-containing protein, partial [Anaerolineaceae bacterium]|nr:FCD domain-containing protein [Anaerolineaceae bacterium]
AAPAVSEMTEALAALPDEVTAYAAADWNLHRQLTILSGNPVFTLILNGFGELYHDMGLRYFVSPEARQHSRGFYIGLLEAARRADPEAAEAHTRQIMLQSQEIWQKII